jgi:S-phase kinase-associated protein 1
MRIFLIKVSDNKIPIKEEALKTSLFFSESLELIEEEKEVELQIPGILDIAGNNISSVNNIKKIVTLMEYMVGKNFDIETPMKKPFESYVDNWIVEFMKIPTNEILELAYIANFLNITSILNICCSKLASICKEKSTNEIRKIFNIESDFSKEEEEEIEKQYRWMDKLQK